MIVHEIENGFASLNSSEKMVKEAVLLDEEEPEISVTPVGPNGFSFFQRTLKIQRKIWI
jgi:hypothetical protein